MTTKPSLDVRAFLASEDEFFRTTKSSGTAPSSATTTSSAVTKSIVPKEPMRVLKALFGIMLLLSLILFAQECTTIGAVTHGFFNPQSSVHNSVLSYYNKNLAQIRHSVIQFLRLPKKQRTKIQSLVREASARYNLPESLILGQIAAESGFNHKAISRMGARGLIQLMPQYHQEIKLNAARYCGSAVYNDFNPCHNIMAGTAFMSELRDHFKGDLLMAIAAYNMGPNHRLIRNMEDQEVRDYLNLNKSSGGYTYDVVANAIGFEANRTLRTKKPPSLLNDGARDRFFENVSMLELTGHP